MLGFQEAIEDCITRIFKKLEARKLCSAVSIITAQDVKDVMREGKDC